MAFWHKWFSKTESNKPVYSMSEGQVVYAVGDIHGRADLLAKLLTRIEKDISSLEGQQGIKLIFLGDYIDRGFHSKEVIEHLINLNIPNVESIFLAGNHEDMLLDFMQDPANGQLWLGVGGLAALASYGIYVNEESDIDELMRASVELQKKLPQSHREFLESLEEDCRVGDYYFVHAGLRPGIPYAAQRRRDKLGIRREFTGSDADFGCCVVHGHTGVRAPERRTNRIAIDTGAFATGVLTAVVLQDSEVRFIST